ncbi:FkbM family methyltransferase [Niveispirillum fermenti]|uniref:FkbM family methyltransferase n=1 Tax=Niveispirillum fermenti TaxID=1233113 RepID=UPI003A8AF52D
MNIDMKLIGADQLLAIMNSPFANISYSQEGEDLLITRIIGHRRSGFYVDVGAHHPYRFSNTFIFYLQGWSGINIDATPGSMEPFYRHRPRDINLEVFVSDRTEPVPFDIFDEPALNTSDTSRKAVLTAYKAVDQVVLSPRRLDAILDEHMPAGTTIDFLSVDAEGADFDVIRSLDLNRYRPRLLITEDRSLDLSRLMENAFYRYLDAHGYALISKLSASVIWEDRRA